jgi:hypothetical protein
MGAGGVMSGYDNGWVGGVVCVLAGFGVEVLGWVGWCSYLSVEVAMDVLDKTQTWLAVHLGLVYIYMTTALDWMAMAWHGDRLGYMRLSAVMRW